RWPRDWSSDVCSSDLLDDPPGDWPYRMRVKTAADGRAAVQLLKRRGVDLIKVHDHTPREAFLAIADEAGRQHLPLAGHVPLAVRTEERRVGEEPCGGA